MRIAALGYYGFGNAGDEQLLRSMRFLLPEHHVDAIPAGFRATEETIGSLNNYDFVLIGGGEIFGGSPPAPFDNFDIWCEKLTSPVGVLGVGVSNIEPRFRGATEALVDEARFFVVRDKSSASKVSYSKIQVAPDLTFLHPLKIPSKPEIRNNGICGVNLRPGAYPLNAWVEAINTLACDKRLIPFSRHPAFDDRDALKNLPGVCPTRFNEELLDGLDIMIGTAFHSVVLAVQRGIPAIAVSYSPKVRNFMSEAGLSEFALELDGSDRLLRVYDVMVRNYHETRSRVLDYAEEMHKAAVEVYNGVATHIKDEAAAHSRRTFTVASHRVSIILLGFGSSVADIRMSIDSCLRQSYANFEVALLIDKFDSEEYGQLLHEKLSRLSNEDNTVTQWKKVLEEHEPGSYVILLHAGSRLSRDAVKIMADALTSHPSLDAVTADVFTMWSGSIDQRLGPRYSADPAQPEQKHQCTMYKLDTFASLMGVSPKMGNDKLNSQSLKTLRIPRGLCYSPAKEAEHLAYRCAHLFAQGDSTAGALMLQDAAKASHIEGSDFVKLMIDTFIFIGYEQSFRRDPIDYWRSVIAQLPADSRSADDLKRKVTSYLLYEEAFIQARFGRRLKALECFGNAIWIQPIQFVRPGRVKAAFGALARHQG